MRSRAPAPELPLGYPGAPPPARRGWRRLVPDALTSTTRRAVWRRTRARRVLAAVLAGLAAWVLVGAVVPRPVETGLPVVVAAHDLPLGATVAAQDLRVERRPESQRPGEALLSVDEATGRVTSGRVTAGEVLTAARFRGPSQLGGLPAGQVAVSVPLLDDGILGSVRVGDLVEVLAPGSGDPVTPGARVLGLDRPGGGVLGDEGSTGRVVLALSGDEARRVAAAMSSQTGVSGFVLALRPE